MSDHVEACDVPSSLSDNATGTALEFLVSGFWFRVPGLGFRISGFGFRVSGLGFRISGLGFRVSGFGFRVSDLPERLGCGASMARLMVQV